VGSLPQGEGTDGLGIGRVNNLFTSPAREQGE
jgi:hypothetical protein